MKKAILGAVCGVLALTSVVSAGTKVDNIVNLGGGTPGTASAKMYLPINDDFKFVGGISSDVYTKNTPSSTLILLGVNADLPVLGNSDIYTEAKFGSVNEFQTIGLSKKWVSKLTDKISVGVQMKVLEVGINGTNKVAILPSITPVIGFSFEVL